MGNKYRTAPAADIAHSGGHELNRPPEGWTAADANAGQDLPLDQYGRKYVFEPNFQGPVRKRSCTDVICLGLFIACLAGWGFVAFMAISKGNINKVLYPTNSNGEICGRGSQLDQPYLLFFDLTKCLNLAAVVGCRTPQVCVEQCPSKAISAYAMASQGLGDLAKMQIRPYCADMPESEWNRKGAVELIEEGLCPAWVLSSKPVLGRCLPSLTLAGSPTSNITGNSNVVNASTTVDNKPINDDTLTKAVTALGYFLSLRDFGERVFNDLSETWWMIGLALIGACILSFLWIVIMRFFAGIMVWTSIALIFILVSGLLGYSVYRYLLIKDVAASQASILQVNFTPQYLQDVLSLRDTWLAFIIILAIVAIIILLVLIALRQRIQIAIELIEEGSKAVSHNLTTLFFPIGPFVLHVAVLLWFASIAMYLSSSGHSTYAVVYPMQSINRKANNGSFVPSPAPPQCVLNGNCFNKANNRSYLEGDVCEPLDFNQTCINCAEMACQFVKYEKSSDAFWMQWYNLFAFFWSMSFVSGLAEIILAGVFATWYWTWDKASVPCCILGQSLCNAVIFHLGTVAFGSLIIAIIQLLRAILNFIEEKLQALNNEVGRCFLCMCKCCLWCLEKFMRFINRNAYIMCAVKSTNFCTSAKDAFNLLMRNIVRVVVLNRVVDFLLFIGKLVIVASVGTMSYFVFSGSIPDLKNNVPTLNYFFIPVICIVLATYWIATSFFNVYSMAVDTLFLCFLEDLERNDGTPERPYFMSRNLQKVVGKMQKFNVARQPKK